MKKRLLNVVTRFAFYEIELDRKAKMVYVSFGRIGTTGQTRAYHFDYVDSAVAFFWNKVNDKLGRGYEFAR